MCPRQVSIYMCFVVANLYCTWSLYCSTSVSCCYASRIQISLGDNQHHGQWFSCRIVSWSIEKGRTLMKDWIYQTDYFDSITSSQMANLFSAYSRASRNYSCWQADRPCWPTSWEPKKNERRERRGTTTIIALSISAFFWKQGPHIHHRSCECRKRYSNRWSTIRYFGRHIRKNDSEKVHINW